MPPQRANVNEMLLSAMDALTETIRQNTEFQQSILRKAQEGETYRERMQTPGWMTRPYEMAARNQGGASTGATPLPVRRTPSYDSGKIPRHGAQEQFDVEGASVGPAEDQTLAPDAYRRKSDLSDWGNIGKAYTFYRNKQQGRVRSALTAFTQFNPSTESEASTPPDAETPGQEGGSVYDSLLHPTRSRGPSTQSGGGPSMRDDEQALTWAVLGEHGGPAFIRNAYLEQYGLRRSMAWAQNSAGQVGSFLGSDSMLAGFLNKVPGVSSDTMSNLSGMFGFATEHPWLTYGAYKGAQGVHRSYQNQLGNQDFGQQFGYGPPPGGQGLFGFTNPLGAGPWNAATQVGVANQAEQQVLMGRVPGGLFGGGLTSAQAQDVTGTLASQGFATNPIAGGGVAGTAVSILGDVPGIGHFLAGLASGGPTGDAATIANNFMQPLMQQYPGLKAADLGQFTDALRNSGTSIGQLRATLNDLGDEAQTTKMTVGQFAAAVAQTGQAFAQMGSSPQGGYALAAGFTDATGLPPEVAAQFGQSPIFQGMTLSRYGILPSGIGDMNAGAFSTTAMATLQMMQRATSGFDQNKYATVNGHRVLVESGQQAQYDQIAAMTGIPSNIVKRMLRDQQGIGARSRALELLGNKGTGTGLFWNEMLSDQVKDKGSDKLTHSQWAHINRQFEQTYTPKFLHQAGLTSQEITKLRDPHSGTMRQRLHDLRVDLNKANQRDQWNQIQNNPNANTVTLQLTGAAAKVLQFPGGRTTYHKRVGNAGGPAYNQTVNTPLGDYAAHFGR